MRIFGGILPWIGYRTVAITWEDAEILGLPADTRSIESLEVEWLGFGMILAAKPNG